MHSSILLATCLQILVSAAPGPAPTMFDLDRLDFLGKSPAPTPAPERRGLNQLFPRQEEDLRTCGYEDADYFNPVTCSVGYACFINSYQNWFGCCSNSACEDKKTSCVPSSHVTDLFSTTGVLYCDYGTDTECYTWKNIDTKKHITYTNYACSDTITVDKLWYYASSVPGRFTSTYGPITVTIAGSSTLLLTTVFGPTTSRTETRTPEPDNNKPVPAGAIAGGVIGGVVALAAIAVGIFFLIRHKKKKKMQNGAAGTAYYGPPVMTGGQGHGMPPSAPMSPQTGAQYHQPQNPHMGGYASPGMQSISPPMSPGPMAMGQAAPAYQPPSSSPQDEFKHMQNPSAAQLP
ncbi:hypothetical protein BDW02DRAFT_576020 [Decorospora gaudefroyi]|uniref:Mid2 domain-containing protein n=1 Tax=Decorospora gaudefroyi TaxID=184978 RepID=A0A6A5KRL7_9PLEO|nr:hypothetical protein BDW02DRAFT_576020 [Decorospora gaudefroyi]